MGLFGNSTKKEAKQLYNKALPLYEQGKYEEALKIMEQAANLEHKEAMYLCGNMEASIKYHSLIAAKWYAKAAKKGHSKADEKLKNLCVDSSVRKEYHLEKELIKRAKKGTAEAQYAYADMLYHDGIDKNDPSRVLLSEKERRQKDIEDALVWALKSAEQGNMDAQLLCALIYSSEMKDKESALNWYKTAIKHEDPWAYHLYASCLSDYKQYEEASELFLKSWDMGDLKWSPLSCIRAYKNIGTKESRTTALGLCGRRISELSKMNQKNDKNSEFINDIAGVLSVMAQIYYEDGDKKSALQWFLRSYNLSGSSDTACRCAKMYYEGDGIKRDYAKAYKLYSTIADGTVYDKKTVYQCGIMQFFGEGVPASPGQAFQYFSRLMNRGDYMGYYLCAVMYYEGIGVPQDPEKASELIEGYPDKVFENMQETWMQECTRRGYYEWPLLKIEHHTVYL